MSAPKTPVGLLVLHGLINEDEAAKWADAIADIEAYAAEKVREATEALKAENADLRQAVAVAEDIVRQASKREVMLSNENADLRARVEAVRKAFVVQHTGLGKHKRIDGSNALLIAVALDLSTPFKEGA